MGFSLWQDDANVFSFDRTIRTAVTMTERRQRGAKAVTWDWQTLTENYSDTVQCYELSNRQAAALLVPLWQATWSTRWFNRPDDFSDVTDFVANTALSLMTPKVCAPAAGGGGVGENECRLPDGITMKNGELHINLCEVNMVINIYQGCGCGCGGAAAGSGGAAAGGGNQSWTYTGSDSGGQALDYGVSQCDFVSYAIPKIIRSAREFVQFIDDNAENTDALVDGLASLTGTIPLIGDVGGAAMQWITTIINAGSSAILSMLNDQDFEYKVMESWVKAHYGDGIVNSVSRQDLLDTVQYLPNTWLQGNALIFPKIVMDGIYRVVSMEKITTRLPLAQGQANTSLCQYIWAQAGYDYEPAPDPVDLDQPFPTIENLLAAGNDWAHIVDFTQFDPRTQAIFDIAAPYSTYDDKSDIGWVLNEGLRETQDIPGAPFPQSSLRFTIIGNGGGGVLTTVYADYLYTPAPARSDYSGIYHRLNNVDYAENVEFNGVQRQLELSVADFTALIDPDRNSGATTDPLGVVYFRRLAVAGSGADLFPDMDNWQ